MIVIYFKYIFILLFNKFDSIKGSYKIYFKNAEISNFKHQNVTETSSPDFIDDIILIEPSNKKLKLENYQEPNTKEFFEISEKDIFFLKFNIFERLKQIYKCNFYILENVKYSEFSFFYNFLINCYLPITPLEPHEFSIFLLILDQLDAEMNENFFILLQNLIFSSIMNPDTYGKYLSFDFNYNIFFNSTFKKYSKILVQEFVRIYSFNEFLCDSLIKIEDSRIFFKFYDPNHVFIRIPTLHLNDRYNISFFKDLKKNSDFYFRSSIIFKIFQIQKIKIFNFDIFKENIKNILSIISNSLAIIEFNNCIIPPEIILFLNSELIFPNLKEIIICSLINNISALPFQDAPRYSIFYIKFIDIDDVSSIELPFEHTCFVFSVQIRDSVLRKLLIFENFAYFFQQNEILEPLNLTILEEVEIFHFFSHTEICNDKIVNIFTQLGKASIFNIIYHNLDHRGFIEYPEFENLPIQNIDIKNSTIDYCCLYSILKIKSLKLLFIYNTSIITPNIDMPLFKDIELHSVSFINVFYDNFYNFLVFLNAFSNSYNFRLNIKTPSYNSFDLNSIKHDFYVLKIFALSWVCILDSLIYLDYINRKLNELSLHFCISLNELLSIFSETVFSELKFLEIFSYKMNNCDISLLSKFKNLEHLFLSIADQEICFHQLFTFHQEINIRYIILNKMNIFSSDLECISKFKRLETLHFYFCIYSEDIAKILTRNMFKNLRIICLKEIYSGSNKNLIEFLMEEFLEKFKIEYQYN